MTELTCLNVASETSSLLFSTLETVETETPAALATSMMVTEFFLSGIVRLFGNVTGNVTGAFYYCAYFHNNVKSVAHWDPGMVFLSRKRECAKRSS